MEFVTWLAEAGPRGRTMKEYCASPWGTTSVRKMLDAVRELGLEVTEIEERNSRTERLSWRFVLKT